jgi:hypothetical protein
MKNKLAFDYQKEYEQTKKQMHLQRYPELDKEK